MDKFQTIGKCFWALILDWLILVPVNIIVNIVFSVGGSPVGAKLGATVSGLLGIVYVILMHYYLGQTVGKVAAKVKVLDVSEKPINLGQSILRSLPQLIPVMFAVSFSTAGENNRSSTEFWMMTISIFTGVFYFLDIIVCAVSAKHRAIHDFIAGTIVARTD